MTSRKTVALLGAAMIAALPAIASANPGAYLGVSLQALEGGLADALGVDENSGVLIGQVMDDSPAEAAGLEPGDIIVEVDGDEVGTPSKLRRVIRRHDPGDEIEVAYLRDDERRVVRVGLVEPADRDVRRKLDRVHELRLGGDRGFLGVMTQPLSGGLDEFFGAENGGALVSDVVEGSPAAKLGLAAGDVIVEIDGTGITNPEELRQVVREHEEETEIEVVWLRDKKEKTGKTTLEIRESPVMRLPRFGKGFPHELPHHFDFDFDADGMRHRVVEILGDEDTKGSLREALEKLEKQIEELREEMEELKSAD